MSNYETVIIITPTVSEDQVKEIINKVRKLIKDLGGAIRHEEGWGPRLKLHAIAETNATGHYYLWEYEMDSTLVKDVDAWLKREQRILRFMIMRLDKAN